MLRSWTEPPHATLEFVWSGSDRRSESRPLDRAQAFMVELLSNLKPLRGDGNVKLPERQASLLDNGDMVGFHHVSAIRVRPNRN
jgi:hypothetical protein